MVFKKTNLLQKKIDFFIKKVLQVHHLQHFVSFILHQFVLIHAHHPQMLPHNPSPNHPTSL
jgi:hypothetical protein